MDNSNRIVMEMQHDGMVCIRKLKFRSMRMNQSMEREVLIDLTNDITLY